MTRGQPERFAHIEHPHARTLAARFDDAGRAYVGAYRVAATVDLDHARPLTDAGTRAAWGSDESHPAI